MYAQEEEGTLAHGERASRDRDRKKNPRSEERGSLFVIRDSGTKQAINSFPGPRDVFQVRLVGAPTLPLLQHTHHLRTRTRC